MHTSAASGSPAGRIVRAVGALLLLALLIVGLPVALAAFAGNPLPAGIPTVDDIRSALVSPDDGSLFLRLLAVVGWLAWASFTGSVVIEAYARLARRPAPAVPGLRMQQRVAAGLIATIAALVVAPTVASANAAPVDAAAFALSVISAPFDPAADSGSVAETAAAATAAGPTVHRVERGEALLDLQDRYGVPWQRIAEANYGKTQPDGLTLQRGQTRIYAGWQLTIPRPPAVDASAAAAGPGSREGLSARPDRTSGFGAAADREPTGTTDSAAPTVATTPLAAGEALVYEVVPGDWMWYIAERYLDDPERYPEIAAQNPQYADRDGRFPDHIEPGWQLRLPADAVERDPIPRAAGATVPAPGPSADALPADPPAPEPAPPLTPEPATPEPAPPPAPELAPAPEPTPAPEPAAESTVTAPAPASPTPQWPTPRWPTPDWPTPEWSAPVEERSEPAVAASPEPAPEESPDGFVGDDSDPEHLLPALFGGAGLLAALVLGTAAYRRHLRHPYHRPGFRFTSPAARRLERSLRSGQQPLDQARLHQALRGLAAGLADRSGPLPDVIGASVDAGSVHLLLSTPCPHPPQPWQDHGDRWTLVAGADLPPTPPGRHLAVLPTLTTVGSQAGIHLLLDLERLGMLTLHGDPARARDLLRHLAAELACNTWSDQVEVLIAGFDPAEAAALQALGPERVRTLPSVADGVAVLERRTGAARTARAHTGAADALAGRVGGPGGDSWMPLVLLVADPGEADLVALTALGRELHAAGRCAIAVATTSHAPAKPGRLVVTTTPDGTVHLRLPWVRASLAAAALPAGELARLAELVHAARTAPPERVPPAPEPESWAAGTDAAGSLLVPADQIDEVTTELMTLSRPYLPPDEVRTGTLPASPTPVMGVGPAGTVAPSPRRRADPDLDYDLAAWHAAEEPGMPRIGVLGPVTVSTTGPAPEQRRRLHTELVVYLAQRAARGADAARLTAALWPDTPDGPPGGAATLQLLISRARQWLGTDPGGGPWLLEVSADLTYRLAEGYLLDWHLFRRLRARGESRGPDGADDLRAALKLVRGVPLAGAELAAAPGTRNPYPWLVESELHPEHLVASVIDTAHQFAEACLTSGDVAGVRWAVHQAWRADPDRSYDQPWRDLMRAEYGAGRTGEVRALVAELMELRDAEAVADLAPDTCRLLQAWEPAVLGS